MSEQLHEYKGEFPDLDRVILPTRACLLSVREQLVPARRISLSDSVTAAQSAPRNEEENAMALMECAWEASNCMELAANVIAPWVDSDAKSDSGIWPLLTEYDRFRATRFYESSHKWPDDKFMALSGHTFRVQGSFKPLLEQMQSMGEIDDAVIQAFEAAQAATTTFLRAKFVHLADAWGKIRAYSNGFEHGLLNIPHEVGTVRDSEGKEVPHVLATWKVGKDEVHGEFSESSESAIRLSAQSGELALDLVDYAADARLRFTDLLEIKSGKVYLRPWRQPFPFWVSKGALPDETIQILNSTDIGWIRETG